MELTDQELKVLINIKEGRSDTHQLNIFTDFNLEQIKKILLRLEILGLITINNKYDKTYNEDCLEATLTDKGKKIYKRLKKN
jgi:hypothetical protein